MNKLAKQMDVVSIHSENDIIYHKTKPVDFPIYNAEVIECIRQMKDYFQKYASYGLAANQLNFPWQIMFYFIPQVAMKIRKDAYETVPFSFMINPVLTPVIEDGETLDWERCLSVPGMQGEVYRYNTVHYSCFNELGKNISGTAKGFTARLIQHEVDHLNGIIYTDRIPPEGRFEVVEKSIA